MANKALCTRCCVVSRLVDDSVPEEKWFSWRSLKTEIKIFLRRIKNSGLYWVLWGWGKLKISLLCCFWPLTIIFSAHPQPSGAWSVVLSVHTDGMCWTCCLKIPRSVCPRPYRLGLRCMVSLEWAFRAVAAGRLVNLFASFWKSQSWSAEVNSFERLH